MDYLETYAQLTTGQLLRLAREQEALTDDARRALEAELQRRGISVQQELALDEALAREEEEERDAEARAEAAHSFWWKADFWTRLLIWIFMAAVCAALALLVTGERELGVSFELTAQLVLVAVLGCAASEALPERWRNWTATFLLATGTLLFRSGLWVWLRF